MFIYIYIYMCVCVPLYLFVYNIYIYIYIMHIHMYIYIYTNNSVHMGLCILTARNMWRCFVRYLILKLDKAYGTFIWKFIEASTVCREKGVPGSAVPMKIQRVSWLSDPI